jgi:hypothetical protein
LAPIDVDQLRRGMQCDSGNSDIMISATPALFRFKEEPKQSLPSPAVCQKTSKHMLQSQQCRVE